MRFLLGFLTALVLLVVAGATVIWMGAYNIGATDPHFEVVRWALDATFRNSVKRRAEGIRAPVPFTPTQVREGFGTFDHVCVQCHGAPGVKRADWASGLRPRPPDLSDHAGHWKPAEIFWIVRHGVKMTGMPALGPTHSDEALWKVVAFVEQLPSLTAEDYARLRSETGARGPEPTR